MTILFIVSIVGVVYLAIAIVRVIAFARRPLPEAPEFLPSMTVLKPIAGDEPELYENLASFCRQHYEAEFEVIFCLHDAGDAALPVVERVVAAFPACSARIVIGENAAIAHPKIANLAKPGAEPRCEIVVIADSDVRVGPEYLRALAASFTSERVGAATCLYGAMPNASTASRLGALHLEDEFAPAVLVALALGPLHFCLGATMAVRRSVLDEIGGLQALGTHIADDHTLGRLVAKHGYEIDLSRYVVRTSVPETTLSSLWTHELRWARTNLALAPLGYTFSFVMYAVPFALLYLLISRNLACALSLLATAAFLRIGLHAVVRRAFMVDRPNAPWLLPLRDSLSLAVWTASFLTSSIRWRSRKYKL